MTDKELVAFGGHIWTKLIGLGLEEDEMTALGRAVFHGTSWFRLPDRLKIHIVRLASHIADEARAEQHVIDVEPTPSERAAFDDKTEVNPFPSPADDS